MKRAILTLILSLTIATLSAQQKPVVGSKVPSLRDVEWLTAAPGQSRPMLIEFYQAGNPSSARLFGNLAPIHQQHGDRVTIVVLTRDSRQQADELLSSPYLVGLDRDGKTFEAFGVRFTPFTMIVDSKGLLHWQGNLSNITEQALTTVK